MAIVTGTSSTYSVGTAGGNREDLEDKIWDLFPADTYALTNFDKVSAGATFHEWLTDGLAAAGENISLEGDDKTYATITNASRLGNYTQIFSKTFLISRTQERVKKAGRSKESARQAMKKMRELKRDVEWGLTRNEAGTAGSASVGRSSAGIESFIGATAASATAAVAVVLSTTTASATTAPLTSGAPAAPTDGATLAAFTVDSLKLALESAWIEGGETDVILVSPKQKKAIDAFESVVTRNIDIGRTSEAVITAANNVFVSSFGVHKVLQHRYMRDSVALCLDTSLWAIAFIDRPFSEELAKTGDGRKYHIATELCLVGRAPKGNAKVVALS
jgi:hypothetical protein